MSEYGELKAAVAGLDNQTRVMARFLAVLGSSLDKAGKELPVLVGDAALEFYSNGSYMSRDIGIFGPDEGLTILKRMGFMRKKGMLHCDEFDILVDWRGAELKKRFRERVVNVDMGGLGRFSVLSPMDLIVDMLYESERDGGFDEWAKTLVELGRSGAIPYDENAFPKYALEAGLPSDALERLDERLSWKTDGSENGVPFHAGL